MIATEMAAAINPYSIAVTPLLSRTKYKIFFVMRVAPKLYRHALDHEYEVPAFSPK
jgi:hypothetical protein